MTYRDRKPEARNHYRARRVTVPYSPDRELQHAISWLYHDDPAGYSMQADIREFMQGALLRETEKLRAQYRYATGAADPRPAA